MSDEQGDNMDVEAEMCGIACACLKVEWRTAELEGGGKTGWWRCVECSREFQPALGVAELETAGHPPLEALRRHGVTRYKAGDVEIELAPVWPTGTPAESPHGHDAGEPWPGAQQALLAPNDPPAPADRGALDTGAAAWAGQPLDIGPEREVSVALHDEQPPVEIDMAATEELFRKQDEKRRGPSE